MIVTFENMARANPERVCFTFVNESGLQIAYTYRQVRLMSAALGRHLRDLGVRQGDCVAVDLPNVELYPMLVLAAAYGGFMLAPIDHTLPSSQRVSRVLDLEYQQDIRLAYKIDEVNSRDLSYWLVDFMAGKTSFSNRPSETTVRLSRTLTQRTERMGSSGGGMYSVSRFRDSLESGRSDEPARTPGMFYPQDTQEEAIHYAERAAHLFDAHRTAVIMFTAGTSGACKMVPLSWRNLCTEAGTANEVLSISKLAIAQVVLPMHTINGLQCIIRSLCNGNSFILYRDFNEARVLADVKRGRATHINASNAQFKSLALADIEACKLYEGIHVNGSIITSGNINRAVSNGLNVTVGYGMTETCGDVAWATVDETYSWTMEMFPGFTYRIVDVESDGFGKLAIHCPGNFGGYLNARAIRTMDGYLLTGDMAAQFGTRIAIRPHDLLETLSAKPSATSTSSTQPAATESKASEPAKLRDLPDITL